MRAQQNNTCNGRCELKKQLKKIAEKEKKESQVLKEKQEVVYTFNAVQYSFQVFTEGFSKPKFTSEFNAKPIAFQNSIYHPPSWV